MTSFILNITVHPVSHNSPMVTSEYFMFGKICTCIGIFVNIDKSNSPSILDLIVYPLGHFSLIIFVVGSKFFRWTYTAIKFPMRPESATA